MVSLPKAVLKAVALARAFLARTGLLNVLCLRMLDDRALWLKTKKKRHSGLLAPVFSMGLASNGPHCLAVGWDLLHAALMPAYT